MLMTVPDTRALDDRDILYTRAEAANYLRKSVPTLERWTRLGIGPTPIPCGPCSVRYRLSDLRGYLGTEAEALSPRELERANANRGS
jgi:hypothetical protein